MTAKVRTRFAPSPTGHVHIGNMRAAIYNWLFSRHAGGRFLVRIEDTDRVRSTPEAIGTVLAALRWLGLDPDEEPLYQSHRREAHLEAAERLLSSGQAYRAEKGGPGSGECVLFRMPGTDMSYDDEIKGTLRKAAPDMQDFVIVRSDANPVFHLANVVDDLHMGITHVIRGDDHVENTYRHLALYRALEADPPRFAHLPMIVNAQGKPYSKRDGAAYVGEFRERGILPEALFNYLALLGWSPGEDREVITRDEMVALFTLDRVQSKAAQFDPHKLEWMNGEYLRALPGAAFREHGLAVLRAAPFWEESEHAPVADRVLELMRERVRTFRELPDQTVYFFCDDFPRDPKAVRKRLQKEGVAGHLADLHSAYEALPEFSAAELEAALRSLAETRGISAGALIHPVRVAVSGSQAGPGLFDMLEVLGRTKVLTRLEHARALATTSLPAGPREP